MIFMYTALAQFPQSSVGAQPGGSSNSQQQDSAGTDLQTDDSNDDTDDNDDSDSDSQSSGMNYGTSSSNYGAGGPQLLSGGGKAGVAVVALVCVGAVIGGVAFFLIRRG